MKTTYAGLSYIPRLVTLAIPIAGQHLLMTLLNLADTVMVGQLGEVQIAAIALGNQVFFLLMLFLFGVGSGSAVFASQYWGRRDVTGVRRSMGVSLMVAVVGSLIFTVASIAFPEVILRVFSRDALVIAEGAGYLRIVAVSYLFTAITMCFAYALRSTGDTRLPLIATAVSIVLNIAGNYVLIFGALGMPALGVRGAAIATLGARIIELVVIVTITYRRGGPAAAPLRDLLWVDRDFRRRFLKRTSPVIVNEIFWSLGFTMYTVVFGRMGTGYLAAYNIADTVSRLLLVFFIGSAQAAAILIGNVIGEAGLENDTPGEPDEPNVSRFGAAQHIGVSLLKILPLVSIVLGAVVFLWVAPVVPRFFAVSPAVAEMIPLMLQAFAVIIAAKILNMHIIVGILRGGGDTTFALLIDVLILWVVGVPAAFLAGLWLRLPAHLVYLAIGLEEVTRMIFGIRRVLSGKWINDLADPVEVLHRPVPNPSDATGFPL